MSASPHNPESSTHMNMCHNITIESLHSHLVEAHPALPANSNTRQSKCSVCTARLHTGYTHLPDEHRPFTALLFCHNLALLEQETLQYTPTTCRSDMKLLQTGNESFGTRQIIPVASPAAQVHVLTAKSDPAGHTNQSSCRPHPTTHTCHTVLNPHIHTALGP